MFYYLYHSIPGSKATKIIVFIVAIVGILALLFFGVFPAISTSLQPDTIVYRN